MLTLSNVIDRKDPDKAQATTKKSNLSLVDETTSVGVEIEMENLAQNYMSRADLMNWERKSDGSLRGNSREFVFDKPLKGDAVIAAIESLSEAFEDKRFERHKTLRTSMHVHVNMLSANRTQLMSILIAAMLADNALFMMTDENRQYLGYCRESREALAGVIGYMHGNGDTDEEIRLYASHSRYYSMNAAALSKYGTLEFRHFATPVDIEEAVRNVNACLKVKQCGLAAWESAGNDNVRKDLEAMYNLVRAQVEATFGNDHEMPEIEEFLELIEAAKATIEYNPVDGIPIESSLMQTATQPTVIPEATRAAREIQTLRRAYSADQPEFYGTSPPTPEQVTNALTDMAELELRLAREAAELNANPVYQEFVRTGVMPDVTRGPLF